jgi:RNA 2',3'-cyclic 3'-phosphodiesterase
MNLSRENKVRLFFALWPSATERVALAAWQPPLKDLCGGRVMRIDTLHATLVFLGEVEEHRLEALRLAAQETNWRGFELKLTTAHYWGHNHIAYATPDATPPQLTELVHELESKLRKHRFHVENRPYKPHVTLLRNAVWSDAKLPSMPAVSWKFNEFVLVQSSRDGQDTPYYDVLARFPILPADA